MENLDELKARCLVFETELWTVHEPRTKQEAVVLGRVQWCTAREGGHYENFYNKSLGDLYVFFKRDKVRPQYQLFVRKIGDVVSTEFRDGGNCFADLRSYLESVPELRPFWDSLNAPLPNQRRRPAVTYQHVDTSTVRQMQADNFDLLRCTSYTGEPIHHNLSCEYVHTWAERWPNPPAGSLIYVADEHAFYCFNGSDWRRIDTVPTSIDPAVGQHDYVSIGVSVAFNTPIEQRSLDQGEVSDIHSNQFGRT